MPKSVKAIAVLNSPKCKGTVNIIEMKNGVKFDVNLTNLTLESTVFISMKQEIWKMVVKVVVLILIPLNKNMEVQQRWTGKIDI